MRDESVGVYLHVPFCERVCPYCDFPVVASRALAPADEEAYVGALERELGARAPAFEGRAIASVYFGGGTPSLLHPGSIRRLLAAVEAAFPLRLPGAPPEVTLELNPSTVERERLPGFRDAGVDRLSVGIQSFDDRVLQRLGRAHRAATARDTLRAVGRAGFDHCSIDLIFGAPDQSLEGLERDLDETLGFAPDHVSLYGLTIEPGTPYAAAVARGRLAPADEELSAAMYERVHERLPRHGLAAYELSSFARAGCESRHNRRYWRREPVLGVGMGAWSIEPPSPRAPHGARRGNRRSLAGYLEAIARGGDARDGPTEVLAPDVARGEAVFLALRTREGLAPGPFAGEFGAEPRAFFGATIDRLVAGGLLIEDAAGVLTLSPRGRLLSDSVFEPFVAPAGV